MRSSFSLQNAVRDMILHQEFLDLVLVPCGLMIMFVYHLILLYRYLKCPQTISLGLENHDRRVWIERIMQAEKSDIGNALSVIGSNLSAATFLASVSLTLSSLIGAWVVNSSDNIFESNLIFGDRRLVTLSIKYICLLACFLLAFAFFVHSARYFVHANYLISMPDNDVPLHNVTIAVLKGGEQWVLGLRALYLALNLLMWFFGPVPMFVSSVITVIVLHFQDRNSTPLHMYAPPRNLRNMKRLAPGHTN